MLARRVIMKMLEGVGRRTLGWYSYASTTEYARLEEIAILEIGHGHAEGRQKRVRTSAPHV